MTATTETFKVGDKVWLKLTDEWIRAMEQEARHGDESQMRLYLECVDAKRDGLDRLAGQIDHVTVELDTSGYAHYAATFWQIGDCGKDVGVAHEDLEPREDV
jgi:hypothetical protein